MTTNLSALYTPEFLAAFLLTVLGVFIFALIRRGKGAVEQEFRLALIQPQSKTVRAGRMEKAKSGEKTSDGGVKPQASKGVGLSGN